jgi:dCTP deaminase
MILTAQSIRRRCVHHDLVAPFSEKESFRSRHGIFTYGLSVAGYDVRAEFDDEGAKRVLELRPGGFALASTVERFNMPRDLVGVVCDKSSWARRGLAVQNTVIEPGWCGHLTLELTNHGAHWLQLERGVPIAQIIFHLTDEGVEHPYDGKYQDQGRGPQGPR